MYILGLYFLLPVTTKGKYSLSMAPSDGASSRPQRTLEPLKNAKRIQSICFRLFREIYCRNPTVNEIL